jgi:parallel beta-helix repeat protein
MESKSACLCEKTVKGLWKTTTISANATAGVVIATGGNPTLRGNHISKSAHAAIWISDDGGGIFEGNDL